MQTPDDVVTAVTQAQDRAQALAIMRMQSPAMVRAVADLLYVDSHGASVALVRRECVDEARA